MPRNTNVFAEALREVGDEIRRRKTSTSSTPKLPFDKELIRSDQLSTRWPGMTAEERQSYIAENGLEATIKNLQV